MSGAYIPDGPIHEWFELTYANYLVLPRSILQSMPIEWQERFVECLREARQSFRHLDWPKYAVNVRDDNGRFISDPIAHYERGRTRLQPQ